MRMLLPIGCMIAAGSMLWAQPDESKLHDAMKQIGPTVGGLNKKIAAKDEGASADAKKLHALFGGVHEFWKEKQAADAVAFAETAQAEFMAVSEQTAAGKWDDAGVSFKKATATCAGCHGAHREKAADGSWKVK
ncbi:MAG: hypothetical protein ABI972_25795 [Acidobacteriota bacterium]